jgi:hypothetical protein
MSFPRIHANPAACATILGLALLGSLAPRTGAETTKPDAAHELVLFMGLDLSVKEGKRFYQVEDVDGSEFVISVDGKNKFVRTRMQSNNLKIGRDLKIAPVSVQLDDMEGQAGYTPAADPRLKFDRRSGAAIGAEAASRLAEYNVTEITDTLSKINPAYDGSNRKGQLEAAREVEQSNLARADYHLSSDYSSTPSMANDLAKELDEGNFDMVDVSFRISSPEPLDDPYMVVLVEFQPRGAKPGESSLLIHAKALDPIDTKPKYIRVREGGMPVGFKFLRHEVHIYNRGREVATNVSSKRVELTREEARLYLVIEHIGANKGATQVAEAVRGSLSPAIRSRLRPDQLENVSYVRVSKDGVPLGVYVDESASLPVSDEDLVAAVKDAFFKPALHDGKPVDGVVRVRLGELTL